MTLGKKLYDIRVAYNMSQEQMGELLGASRQTVSKWELDQVTPELKKIIAISRLFCVPTDELLLEVSNFQKVGQRFVCGVYSDENGEIVETERLALCFYHRGDHIMGAKLYDGNGDMKYLLSICEKDIETNKVAWAYAETEKPGEIVNRHSNNSEFEKKLGELFDRSRLDKMNLQESFFANHGEFEVHTVSEMGIRKCLLEWRKGSAVRLFDDGFEVQICVGNKEYIYSVKETDDNIYCGISLIIPFELGLRSYGQYFRLRNYQDNSQPYCSSFWNFNYKPAAIDNFVNEVNLGCVIQDSDGNFIWYVKRYNDTEIVIAGCGGDEYRFSMDETKYEHFA